MPSGRGERRDYDDGIDKDCQSVLLLAVFEMVFEAVVVVGVGGVSVKNSPNSLMERLRFEWPKMRSRRLQGTSNTRLYITEQLQ